MLSNKVFCRFTLGCSTCTRHRIRNVSHRPLVLAGYQCLSLPSSSLWNHLHHWYDRTCILAHTLFYSFFFSFLWIRSRIMPGAHAGADDWDWHEYCPYELFSWFLWIPRPDSHQCPSSCPESWAEDEPERSSGHCPGYQRTWNPNWPFGRGNSRFKWHLLLKNRE